MAQTYKFGEEILTIPEAAKKFKIHRNTLRNRLAKHPPDIAVKLPHTTRSERGKIAARKIASDVSHPWVGKLNID